MKLHGFPYPMNYISLFYLVLYILSRTNHFARHKLPNLPDSGRFATAPVSPFAKKKRPAAAERFHMRQVKSRA